MKPSASSRRWWLAALALVLIHGTGRAQHGVYLSGIGAGNRAMGGVGTALSLDPSGSLMWNPATLSGYKQSQLDFGVEGLFPRTRLSSTISPGTLGPGFPSRLLSGTTDGDGGLFALPSFGLVWVPPESQLTFGLGVACVGGFGLNYPASPNNPVLSPQAPTGLGVGNLHAKYSLIEMTPTVSYRVNDNLSVGFSPILGFSDLTFDPGFVFAPDDANGDGFFTFPDGQHSRGNIGGGFQLGAFWQGETGWNFGASFKSPIWFDRFRYNSADELGNPRLLKFGFDGPMIVSGGVSYTGFEKLVVALDFRFIDYHNTRGYEKNTFESTGALKGIGLNSVYVFGLGGAYQLTDRLNFRLGYSYNNNPINQDTTFFNIASALLIQHILSTGFVFDVTDSLSLTFAYVRSFEGTSTGAIILPTGPIPNSTVTTESTVDSVVFGVKVKF
jgi:long-chain fatty acid transport protein